jgi:ubiquinone/menaquinone biosynthesis C-methylase UbiE
MRRLVGRVAALRRRGERGSERVRLAALSPKRVEQGWLLTLRVENLGAPISLRAEVGPRGSAKTRTRDVSTLDWRHGSRAPNVRLGSRDAEVVRLALARTSLPEDDLVLLTTDAPNAQPRFGIGPKRKAVVPVRLVDASNGVVLDERSVRIELPEQNGPPRVHLTREAERSVRLAQPTRFAPVPAPAAAMPTLPIETIEQSELSSEEARALEEVLRCSVCASPYRVSPDVLVCTGCGIEHPVIDGVPVLNTESTVATKLEQNDYDAVHGLTEQRIRRTGAQWKEVIDRLGLPTGSGVEIGAGTGALTLGLLQQKVVSRLVATDVSEKFLRIVRTRVASYDVPVSLVACDANERHFRAESFDIVVGRSILHHLLDFDQTLKACHDMLKPGGAAVFFEPILEGKIVVTLLLSLILASDERAEAGYLSASDRDRMRTLIGNHMKSKWLSQDRATLSKVEDKYIFTIDQMRKVGDDAGFRDVQFVNNGDATPSYWQFVVETCRSGGIPPERIEPYKWIDDQFANTCGLMFTEKLLTPMGYFVFRKRDEA